MAALREDTGIDLLLGIGGTPEGIIAACAIKCLGGVIQGRLWPKDDEERQRAIDAGHDLDAVLSTDDLVTSENCFFVATGITDGELLRGVRYRAGGATTHSIVMRSKSGTIRLIESHHQLAKLRAYSAIDFDHAQDGHAVNERILVIGEALIDRVRDDRRRRRPSTRAAARPTSPSAWPASTTSSTSRPRSARTSAARASPTTSTRHGGLAAQGSAGPRTPPRRPRRLDASGCSRVHLRPALGPPAGRASPRSATCTPGRSRRSSSRAPPSVLETLRAARARPRSPTTPTCGPTSWATSTRSARASRRSSALADVVKASDGPRPASTPARPCPQVLRRWAGLGPSSWS